MRVITAVIAMFSLSLWLARMPDKGMQRASYAVASLGVLVAIALAFMPIIGYKAAHAAADVIDNTRWEPIVCWAGFTLIIVGFSFDLLSS